MQNFSGINLIQYLSTQRPPMMPPPGMPPPGMPPPNFSVPPPGFPQPSLAPPGTGGEELWVETKTAEGKVN